MMELEKEGMEIDLDGKAVFEDLKYILRNMQYSVPEIVIFYKTAVELLTIDFCAFNQTQSVALALPEKLHIETLGGYLPSNYFLCVDCTHVCKKKLPWVLETVLEDLYNIWVPQHQKLNPT